MKRFTEQRILLVILDDISHRECQPVEKTGVNRQRGSEDVRSKELEKSRSEVLQIRARVAMNLPVKG